MALLLYRCAALPAGLPILIDSILLIHSGFLLSSSYSARLHCLAISTWLFSSFPLAVF